MFTFFKSKNPYVQPAKKLYGTALGHIRNPEFYTRFNVPDTLDGRFDLLVLHLFMAMNVLKSAEGQRLSQALFDVAFNDMDQTLREIGIGDMGITKHMKRMMKGFNGRVHAYDEALDDQGAFFEALRRNLFGTMDNPDEGALMMMHDYVHLNVEKFKQTEFKEFLSGEVKFINPQTIKETQYNEPRTRHAAG